MLLMCKQGPMPLILIPSSSVWARSDNGACHMMQARRAVALIGDLSQLQDSLEEACGQVSGGKAAEDHATSDCGLVAMPHITASSATCPAAAYR